jgi:hypothetical protein
MFIHTGCPAVAISLENGTFDPDASVSATLSTDLKTLTISVPSANPKLKTASWTVPVVGATSIVPIKFDTSPTSAVESALSLNLAFGSDPALAAKPAAGRKAPAKKVAAKKKTPAKKAASKVAPKKRK